MHLVNLTTAGFKKIVGSNIVFLLIFSTASAQENSPYSRYGLGDLVPNANVANRGMGGIAAGYSNFLNLNFKNPASLGSISTTRNVSNAIFDVGGEIDMRTLKSTNTTGKYKSTNTLISYLQIGFPVSSPKMERKGTTWGVSFGLRPISRINYKVERNERISGIDSLNTLFEGSGGVNQVNVSTGVKIKNLSLGVSTGYTFGSKDYSTQKVFINDTVSYYKSNQQISSTFGGVFLNTGIQYLIPTNRSGFLKLGAYANLQQNLRAKQDNVIETFAFDGNGGTFQIDSINAAYDVRGEVKMPATYGVGFTYADKDNNWLLGADFEMTNWDSYRYYDKTEGVQNSWVIRMGAEYYPAKNNTPGNKYWKFVKYRAGFFYGPDYVVVDKTRNNYAATLGASFPLTATRLLAYGDFVLLNAAIEAGGRGNKQSFSFRENNMRISIGVSMNARWFQKRSYQ